MKKILFISGGKTITEMFVDIIQELGSYDVLTINRDYYFKENSAKIIEHAEIVTKGLETYKTKDVKKILKIERPQIIVVGHDSSAIERSFILAGKSLGIPSLLVQDGIVNLPGLLTAQESIFGMFHLFQRLRLVFRPSLYLLFTCGITTYCGIFFNFGKSHTYGRGECSKVAVMSPYAKKVFKKLGFNSKNLIITGQPRFDRLFKPKLTRLDLCTKLDIDSAKDIILLAPPIFAPLDDGDNKRRVFIKAVVGALKFCENAQLVIKIHPGIDEKTFVYEEILKQINCENVMVVKDFDIPSLLNASSLFLSHYSTMAMEALILQKPVIIINMFGDSEYYPFVSSGAALEARNAEEILTAIKRISCGEFREKMQNSTANFVFEHAYKTDGKASKRVADLIIEICKSK